RMQMTVPEVMDIGKEPASIQELYGAKPGAASLANNCLLARRLVERGVRFVQLFDWGWDCHGTSAGDDIVKHLPQKCKEMDRPVAALLGDLKQRGLLDQTLIVWGGEFGRTSMNEARGGSTFLGRDHHPHCFTLWLAGAGIKGGVVHGATDELGYFITEGKTSVHDLQATLLTLLGLDPTTGQTYDIHHPELVMVARRFIYVGLPSKENPIQAEQVTQVALIHITELQNLAASTLPHNGPPS